MLSFLFFEWGPRCNGNSGVGGRLFYKLFVDTDFFHLVSDMLIDDYPLRITGGTDFTNGLVEYLNQDRWRPMLNHNRQLNVANATMICRLLGFTRGTIVTRQGS